MHTLDDGGVTAFLTTWQTYGFALSGAAALFFLENAMPAGPLVASQPAITLGDAGVSLALSKLPLARALSGEDRKPPPAEAP